MTKFERIIQHKFDDTKKQAIFNLFFTSNFLQGKIAEALRPMDLTMQQLNILAIVKGQPDGVTNVNTIKERMFDRMSNVSRLLNKLVAKGWIEKERRTDDQRVVDIKITDSGNEIRIKGRKVISNTMETFEHLNDEESEIMTNLLEKLQKDFF